MYIYIYIYIYIMSSCRDITFGAVTSTVTLAITGKYCLLDGFTGHLSTCFPGVSNLENCAFRLS